MTKSYGEFVLSKRQVGVVFFFYAVVPVFINLTTGIL